MKRTMLPRAGIRYLEVPSAMSKHRLSLRGPRGAGIGRPGIIRDGCPGRRRPAQWGDVHGGQSASSQVSIAARGRPAEP